MEEKENMNDEMNERLTIVLQFKQYVYNEQEDYQKDKYVDV